MSSLNSLRAGARSLLIGSALLPFIAAPSLRAAPDPALLNDLVSYWPLDELVGNKTPDLKSGFDLTVSGSYSAANLVTGQKGSAFDFKAVNSNVLYRLNAPGADLPIGNQPSFTVSMWTNINDVGQADLRVFAETNTSANLNPLFTLGTKQNAPRIGELRTLFRSNTPQVDSTSAATPFNGTGWRHIVWVQEDAGDGTATRRLYVDGVLDSVTIGPKAVGTALNATNTAIGGLYRSSPGAAFITGQIDEVAVWKRALTESEIANLMAEGLPEIAPPPAPLTVASFTADFPRVAAGRSTRLSWDVNADATVTITPGPGDVTAQSDFGVGSVTVTPAADTPYTLTITRGADTPVTSSVTVTVEPDVATGWDFLDTFQTRTLGGIGSQSPWQNGGSSAGLATPWAVAASGGLGNQILTSGSEIGLAGLNLGSLAVPEGKKATLFFRFRIPAGEVEKDLNLYLGLSDKTVRFAEDWATNNGPGLRFTRTGGGPVIVSTRNGPGSAYAAANFTPTPDQAYEVWLDVDNVSGVADIFSIHVAPVGDVRTTIVNAHVSDRLATENPPLGFPRPTLSSVVLSAFAPAQNAGIQLDDFFLSVGDAYLTGVPLASQLTNVPAVPDVPGAVSATVGNNVVNLTWAPGVGSDTYTVRRSDTPGGGYIDLSAGVITGTSYQDNAVTNGNTYYYVIAAVNEIGASADSLEVAASPAGSDPLAAWRETNFGSPDNTGAGANDADPDGDGVANLLEYATGTDPNVVTPAPATVTRVGGVLTLTFNHIGDPNLIYTVQATNDLGVTFGPVQTYTALGVPGTTVYTDDAPLATTPRRFLRLQVGLAP